METATSSYVLKNPLAFYEKDKERISLLETKLSSSMNVYMKDMNKKYELLLNKLDLLSPLGILKKGYSVVTKDDKVIQSAKKLKKGDKIDIRLHEGTILAEVKETKEK